MPTHVEPALRLMRTFANALEESGARIKTLRVRSNLFGFTSRRPQSCKEERTGTVKFMSATMKEEHLYHRMLEAAALDKG